MPAPRATGASAAWKRRKSESSSDSDEPTLGEGAIFPWAGTHWTWKKKIYSLFDPDSDHMDNSWWLGAQVITFTTFLAIILSCFTFCYESMPSQVFSRIQGHEAIGWYVVETTCIMWFTLELIIRFVTCPSRLTFIKQPLNWIDVATVTPWYIEFILRLVGSEGTNMDNLAIFRILRIARVSRVLKVGPCLYLTQGQMHNVDFWFYLHAFVFNNNYIIN